MPPPSPCYACRSRQRPHATTSQTLTADGYSCLCPCDPQGQGCGVGGSSLLWAGTSDAKLVLLDAAVGEVVSEWLLPVTEGAAGVLGAAKGKGGKGRAAATVGGVQGQAARESGGSGGGGGGEVCAGQLAAVCDAASVGGAWVAAGCAGGAVAVLHRLTGVVLAWWQAHRGSVTALAPVSVGVLASCGADRVLRLWDMRSPGQPSVHTVVGGGVGNVWGGVGGGHPHAAALSGTSSATAAPLTASGHLGSHANGSAGAGMSSRSPKGQGPSGGTALATAGSGGGSGSGGSGSGSSAFNTLMSPGVAEAGPGARVGGRWQGPGGVGGVGEDVAAGAMLLSWGPEDVLPSPKAQAEAMRQLLSRLQSGPSSGAERRRSQSLPWQGEEAGGAGGEPLAAAPLLLSEQGTGVAARGVVHMEGTLLLCCGANLGLMDLQGLVVGGEGTVGGVGGKGLMLTGVRGWKGKGAGEKGGKGAAVGMCVLPCSRLVLLAGEDGTLAVVQ